MVIKMKKRSILILVFTLLFVVVFTAACTSNENKDNPVTVTIGQRSVVMYKDDEFKLTAVVENSTAAVEWSSSNAAVATVSADGNVFAKAAGSATITAKVGNKTDTSSVTVKNIPYLNYAAVDLEIGDVLPITVQAYDGQTLTVGNTNTAVAEAVVSGNKVTVTARAGGTAVISVREGNRVFAECTVNVSDKIGAVVNYPDSLYRYLLSGESYTLSELISMSVNGEEYEGEFTCSSASDIVTINNDTLVAERAGTAQLDVTAAGKTITVEIDIEDKYEYGILDDFTKTSSVTLQNGTSSVSDEKVPTDAVRNTSIKFSDITMSGTTNWAYMRLLNSAKLHDWLDGALDSDIIYIVIYLDPEVVTQTATASGYRLYDQSGNRFYDTGSTLIVENNKWTTVKIPVSAVKAQLLEFGKELGFIELGFQNNPNATISTAKKAIYLYEMGIMPTIIEDYINEEVDVSISTFGIPGFTYDIDVEGPNGSSVSVSGLNIMVADMPGEYTLTYNISAYGCATETVTRVITFIGRARYEELLTINPLSGIGSIVPVAGGSVAAYDIGTSADVPGGKSGTSVQMYNIATNAWPYAMITGTSNIYGMLPSLDCNDELVFSVKIDKADNAAALYCNFDINGKNSSGTTIVYRFQPFYLNAGDWTEFAISIGRFQEIVKQYGFASFTDFRFGLQNNAAPVVLNTVNLYGMEIRINDRCTEVGTAYNVALPDFGIPNFDYTCEVIGANLADAQVINGVFTATEAGVYTLKYVFNGRGLYEDDEFEVTVYVNPERASDCFTPDPYLITAAGTASPYTTAQTTSLAKSTNSAYMPGGATDYEWISVLKRPYYGWGSSTTTNNYVAMLETEAILRNIESYGDTDALEFEIYFNLAGNNTTYFDVGLFDADMVFTAVAALRTANNTNAAWNTYQILIEDIADAMAANPNKYILGFKFYSHATAPANGEIVVRFFETRIVTGTPRVNVDYDSNYTINELSNAASVTSSGCSAQSSPDVPAGKSGTSVQLHTIATTAWGYATILGTGNIYGLLPYLDDNDEVVFDIKLTGPVTTAALRCEYRLNGRNSSNGAISYCFNTIYFKTDDVWTELAISVKRLKDIVEQQGFVSFENFRLGMQSNSTVTITTVNMYDMRIRFNNRCTDVGTAYNVGLQPFGIKSFAYTCEVTSSNSGTASITNGVFTATAAGVYTLEYNVTGKGIHDAQFTRKVYVNPARGENCFAPDPYLVTVAGGTAPNITTAISSAPARSTASTYPVGATGYEWVSVLNRPAYGFGGSTAGNNYVAMLETEAILRNIESYDDADILEFAMYFSLASTNSTYFAVVLFGDDMTYTADIAGLRPADISNGSWLNYQITVGAIKTAMAGNQNKFIIGFKIYWHATAGGSPGARFFETRIIPTV
jgi:hypothetical protein